MERVIHFEKVHFKQTLAHFTAFKEESDIQAFGFDSDGSVSPLFPEFDLIFEEHWITVWPSLPCDCEAGG